MSKEQIFDWIYDDPVEMRIDKFLAEECEQWSRTQIQNWIKEGRVTVNGRPVKANYKLSENDYVVLRVPPPRELSIEPEQMDLDIVYEDEDVLVVNKPRGLVVHPAPGHYSGTLVNGLLAHCQNLSGINGILRPGIVHRIDKDTSGLLMVAKNDRAHLSLAKQLSEHRVIRKYVALVHGQVGHNSGTINAPIGRNPHNRQQMAVVSGGKPAVTHFQVIKRFNRYTLIECQLETGRTHQIRVHLKYIGHPLAGDPVYGPAKTLPIKGQALHAKVLGFEHPATGRQMIFDSPLPEDMEEIIKTLE
ncbi:pseudouridine synthase, RluA family [Caldalkalibacillus thermarum TA2.A1]|uniref:Pseudouridine synthase n=1 Tax=Caldalkalibacillus thermarum (strain TA2.A1) TaxID=986075 RepID=F5L927_CALTT|nr:RluA family pseudouridine synthase [Caldalkalibacillus thermarum]EGL82201.1 pseudouridine synthase, RluA family [Caldalkalibacillus thermarum TA2.A1]QZT33087.1 RluA family pseudouridine synthase [Caldalkalibacillus thermarum TA2.A1]